MNGLPFNAFIEALGWMLLHVVWQGTAIAAALWCLLRLAQNSSAQFRYGAACTALLLILTTGMATFAWTFDVQKAPARRLTPAVALDVSLPILEASSWTDNRPAAPPIARETADPITSPTTVPSISGVSALAGWLRPWLSWVVGLWVIGVSIHSLRFFVGWRAIRGMRAEGGKVDDALWVERFDCLRKRLGVSSRVRLLASATVTVPMVIGCLKPVVLVPTSLLTGLSPSQVEAILMHELTHIRRHDYLVNLLQNMVEILFFYHPAVWWISAQIRQEREHCCDDVAAASCGNSVEYARALTALEELRSEPSVLSVAASGGSLLDRVRRLTGVHHPAPNLALWPVPVLAVLILLGVALPMAMLWATEAAGTTNEAAQQEPAEKTPEESASAADDDEQHTNPKVLQVTGKVVDDETGEPVTQFIIQGGRFDPDDRTQVTWGFGEQTENSPDGTLGCGVSVSEGWTARILADGYLPHPIIDAATPTDLQSIEVIIRLQRGRLVRGQVLDHTGQPLSGAAVAALRPTRINLYGGKTHSMLSLMAEMSVGLGDFSGIGDTVKSVQTDDAGRFALHIGAVERLGITHQSLDAWVAPVPKEGDVIVRLPAPARIEITYDIPGDDAEGKILLQMLSEYMPGFEGLQSTRMITIKNGDRLVLPGVTPGKYQVVRHKSQRIGRRFGIYNLDREYFEIKPGEMKTIDYAREHGARLRGQIRWPEGFERQVVMINVQSEELVWDPFSGRELSENSRAFIQHREARALQKVGDDGSFLTERVLPGRYRLVAEGYTMSVNPLGGGFSPLSGGPLHPPVNYRAETTVDVPDSGELVVPDLVLKAAE